MKLRLALPLAACAMLFAGCVAGPPRSTSLPQRIGEGTAGVGAAVLPLVASQGAMVIGSTHPAATVAIDGRVVRVAADGTFVFGIGRDATSPLVVTVKQPGAGIVQHRIVVTPRDWPVERIVGVPPETVNPPPEVAARIEREQALVSAARVRDDAREDFTRQFAWPVQGRISGRFGNQRVYVLPDGTDVPKTPHSGMDIAAPEGTPVLAPAPGIVRFTGDLYLTGNTILLDHGHGISSNFLHLSRIDVHVGQRVEQGQAIGAVGSTGRATGPHLHWGMNWFETRIDPLLVLDRGK
jgi:hypothetical protein